MHDLKEEEGGLTAMCDVMEKYEKIAADKAADKATAEATATAIQNMLDLGLTKEQILKKYTAEQFYSAVNIFFA